MKYDPHCHMCNPKPTDWKAEWSKFILNLRRLLCNHHWLNATCHKCGESLGWRD